MRLHFRLSGALVGAIAALAIAELSCPASAQDQPAAKDTIFARKILMGAIDMNMDEIETMLAPEGKLVLGKHSGRHALNQRCQDLGFTLTREELDGLYHRFTALADRKKGVLDGEIAALIEHAQAKQAASD